MKTTIAAQLLTTTTAMADDITVTVSGPYMKTNKVITTNETSLGGLFWDGLDGGGHDEITARLDGTRVVVAEKSYSFSQGLGNDTISKNFIPTNKIPYTLVLSQTTVTVSRAENTPSNEPK